MAKRPKPKLIVLQDERPDRATVFDRETAGIVSYAGRRLEGIDKFEAERLVIVLELLGPEAWRKRSG
jgi:hypothetical protein